MLTTDTDELARRGSRLNVADLAAVALADNVPPSAEDVQAVRTAAATLLDLDAPRLTGWRFWTGQLSKPRSAELTSPWGSPAAGLLDVSTSGKRQLPAVCIIANHLAPAPECSCGYYVSQSLADLVRWIKLGPVEDLEHSGVFDRIVIGRVRSIGRTASAPAHDGPDTFRAQTYDIVGPLYLSPQLSKDGQAVGAFRSTFGCPVVPTQLATVPDWLENLTGRHQTADPVIGSVFDHA